MERLKIFPLQGPSRPKSFSLLSSGVKPRSSNPRPPPHCGQFGRLLWGRPMHCGVFGSIPGFDARRNPRRNNHKCPQRSPSVPWEWGDKLPLVETLWV